MLCLFPVWKFVEFDLDLDLPTCPPTSIGTTAGGIAVVAARGEIKIVIAAAVGTTGAKTVATVDHSGAVTVTAVICPRVNGAGHHLETVIERGHARPSLVRLDAIGTAECHLLVAPTVKGRVAVKELLSASRKEARMKTGVK